MIISKKWKYIFIGLPFSASSAISKELVRNYEGVPVSWKHSNITDSSVTREIIKDYFVFCVYRNPIDITFSYYNKILTNAYNVYTQKEYFIENGGWVTKKERRIYHKVRNSNLDFEAYLRLTYTFPYDSLFSLNQPYIDEVVYFDELNDSFTNTLDSIGVPVMRDLPVVNKTVKTCAMEVSETTCGKVFGPFLKSNAMPFDYSIPNRALWLYRAIQPIRFLRWRRRDRQMRGKEYFDYESL